MDLSIIIPCYNSQKYIKNCLESILNQLDKRVRLEVLIVDDNSNDQTYKIISKYKKKHQLIKVLKNKKNLGVSKSRNLAIKKASGKYILFLDSDDEIIKKTLKDLVFITRKESVDVFVLRNKQIGKNSLDKNEIITINKKSKNLIESIRDVKKFRATCWNFLIKRSFLLKKKIFFKNLRIFEDQYFVSKVLQEAASFKIYKKIIYNRRLEEPNTLSKIVGYNTAKSCLKLMIEISKLFLKNKNLKKKNKRFFISRVKFLTNLLLLNLLICEKNQIRSIGKKLQIYKKMISKLNPALKKINLMRFKEKKINLFLKQLDKRKIYLIFCAWYYSEIVLKICLKHNYRVKYVVDNNLFYKNKNLHNKKIIHSSDLKNHRFKHFSLIICNKDKNHIKRITMQLKKIYFDSKEIVISNI